MAILIQADLVDPFAVERILMDAMAERLTQAFRRASSGISRRVGAAAVELIQTSPEYASLLTGRLRSELGVVSAEPVLLQVCRNIAAGVLVTPQVARRVGNKVEGGLTVELLKGDYSEVLVPGGTFRSEGGFEIDWLRWLTLEGDRVIVGEYHFEVGFPHRSRTGTGIMLPGGKWRVPPENSGTASDNFLTRALTKIGPPAEVILYDEIVRGL